jgi:septal ring factor EnvC (AmiA/AmiB activator)
MSNEEIERKMAFIVEQQAQFASDIQRLEESQARTDQVVAQTGEIVARLANVTHVGFNDVNAKINALVDSQMRTDETVRNLVAVVDRYFREGRNGNSN